MKKRAIQSFVISCLMYVFSTHSLAQTSAPASDTLSYQQQQLVLIAACTAKGDMAALEQALHAGLDAGISIESLKEVLVQLYAYAGFPRSLNALHAMMEVLDNRKQRGLHDEAGKLPSPLPASESKLSFGTAMQTKLVGQPVKGDVYAFAPAIDQFLKEHLFGDIFGRDNLDWTTRELATISALAVLGGTQNQLRSHFNVGMYNGLSAKQLVQIVTIIYNKVSPTAGIEANMLLQEILKTKPDSAVAIQSINAPSMGQLFPTGERITNTNFTGRAYLQPLVAADSLHQTSVGNVTFEPGARTNWHYHPGGQILLVIDGIGFYQEKGSAKKILRKGDVVKCPPNVLHWHGASKDEPFVQLAITNMYMGPVVWMHPVTIEEYLQPPN